MSAWQLPTPRRDDTARDALRLLHAHDRPAPLTSVGLALVEAVSAVRDGERRAMWPRVAERCFVVCEGMG